LDTEEVCIISMEKIEQLLQSMENTQNRGQTDKQIRCCVEIERVV
jgi:hypothetical protein